MSLRRTFNRLMGGFIFFAILAIGQGVSAEITFDIIDDFEEEFVPKDTFGQIPPGWTVIGSNTVKYSQGNEAYNGLYGLHANATRYSDYYGVLVKEAFNTGYSNETIHFSIHAKAQTSGACSFALAITSDGTTTEDFLYWDSNSETDWRTAELDIDVPQSGEVEIALIFGHDTSSGSSTIDVDYLTIGCFESIYYRDVDEDGYGNPSDSIIACEPPVGYVINHDDCDDGNALVNPGASESVADGMDQNCDGGELCYVDADDDGYRPDDSSTVASANLSCTDSGEAVAADPVNDCDDGDASVNPGATEVCSDNIDNDCLNGDLICQDNSDYDNDGLSYGEEVNIYLSNPHKSDTDDDMLDDGIEVTYWGADWNANPDGDLLVNLLDPDSDNDGLNDGFEVNILGTDPALIDTDTNGIPDGDEDYDGDGFTNAEEVQCGSDPVDSSSRCARGLPWLMLLLD